MNKLEVTAEHRVFDGALRYCRHDSAATGTAMRFTVFEPPGQGPFPLLVWLSGLTASEDNFTTKAHAYQAAAAHGLMVVACDTSPRGDVPDDPAYDLGQGAGFYLDATEPPWAPRFAMETYVTRDLIGAVRETFPAAPERIGVCGHSMGGHGALTLALRRPALFTSVSAFAPIASPTRCPWGRKAFTAYLGKHEGAWRGHDASLLIEDGASHGRFDDILVDQGAADPYLAEQLRPELLEAACRAAGQTLRLRRHEGYDHSYFFIQTFIADHIAWHAARLG